MKESIIQTVVVQMQRELDYRQVALLKEVLTNALRNVDLQEKPQDAENRRKDNEELLVAFVAAKKVEGCSDKTLAYYRSTIEHMFSAVDVMACHIETADIRQYMFDYQEKNGSSKITVTSITLFIGTQKLIQC